MKQIIYILLNLLIFFSACTRRPLDMEYYDGVPVKVNIDWSLINPIQENMLLVLYPEDKSEPLIYRYINSVSEIVWIPQGNYSILLYNWRVNENNQSVKFNNILDKSTFYAYTDFTKLSLFSEDVLIQPDSLYSWNTGTKVISIQPNNKQEYSTDSDPIAILDMLTINTKPITMVKKISFFIPVEGLEYAHDAEAVINGVSRSKYLYSKENSMFQNSLKTSMPSRYSIHVSIEKQVNGLRCYFSTFDFIPDEKKEFTIRFSLLNNTVYEVKMDVTNEIDAGFRNDLKKIILPYTEGSNGGFKEPEINGWDEKTDYIML